MYDNLPTWLRGKQKAIAYNKLSLKLPNGSEILATSAASDSGRSYAATWVIIDEAAFIEGIDKIYSSLKPTIATGGGIIALSSPNGIGNWFHKTFTKAVEGKHPDGFFPIRLPWYLHPDRDEQWEQTEKVTMSPREFAQEYDCDFLGSGNTVVESEILKFYEETYIQEPVERRFMGGDFWIWQYPDYHKQYIVTADVARGDGSDYSAFHVIDVDGCEQVGEFKSKIGTREYGHMLVSVATEYNNALLVIENATVGWEVINTAIERAYPNLYYSPRSYGDMNPEKYMDKMLREQTVPGFTNSARTRPLVISKMESYIRERSFIFHSRRLLEELRVFLWLNGKAQAQHGYNDDLVMSLGFGLFIRDTAAKFVVQNNDLIKASMNNVGKSGYEGVYPTYQRNFHNPYQMNVNGNIEDIGWVL